MKSCRIAPGKKKDLRLEGAGRSFHSDRDYLSGATGYSVGPPTLRGLRGDQLVQGSPPCGVPPFFHLEFSHLFSQEARLSIERDFRISPRLWEGPHSSQSVCRVSVCISVGVSAFYSFTCFLTYARSACAGVCAPGLRVLAVAVCVCTSARVSPPFLTAHPRVCGLPAPVLVREAARVALWAVTPAGSMVLSGVAHL